MGPVPRGPYRAPEPFLHHEHHHPLLTLLIVLLVIAAVAALVAYFVARLPDRRRPHPPTFAPGGPPMHDEALAQLRLRYARGEVSRTDFLQAATDLGAPRTESSPP